MQVVSISDLPDIDLKANDTVFYTSSDDESIRAYVKDHIYLASKFCRVIPSFDALMAHENKGFQAIFRKKMGLGDLSGTYFFHLEDAPVNYPYVYKTSTGAGSSGVELIKKKGDEKKLSKNFRVGLYRRLAIFLRKMKLSLSEFAIYQYRHKGKCLSVSQEFVPGLDGDYKILVFGNRFYVLLRKVANNSFKASGSGNFSFPGEKDVDSSVLDYAKDVFFKLDVPYASLDVAHSESQNYLIEYQATNFGPYTLLNSNGYFVFKGGRWGFVEGKSDLQKSFSMAMIDYLERKNVKSDQA